MITTRQCIFCTYKIMYVEAEHKHWTTFQMSITNYIIRKLLEYSFIHLLTRVFFVNSKVDIYIYNLPFCLFVLFFYKFNSTIQEVLESFFTLNVKMKLIN